MMLRNRLALGTSALTVAMSLATAAAAQDAAPVAPQTSAPAAATPADAAPAADAGHGLQEIVVTAQKRAQSLQNVPISVSVVGADTLAKTSIKTVADLPALAPAITFTAGSQPAFLTFTVRGVGSYVYRIGIQPAVSVVIDGVPYARTSEFAGELGDVQRVEVLSGPQGTLFGRNSTGGAVNIVRNQPGDKFGGTINSELGIGQHGDVSANVSGAIDTPIIDGVRNRVYAFNNWNSDYIKNTVPGAPDDGKHHSYGFADKLAIDIGPKFKLVLSGDYSHVFDRNGLGEVLVPLQASQQPFIPNIAQVQTQFSRGAVGDPFKIAAAKPFFGTSTFGGGLADLTFKANDHLSIKSLTSYRKNKIDYFASFYPFPMLANDPQGFGLISPLNADPQNVAFPNSRLTKWHYFTEELRVQYTSKLLDAVAGGYFFRLNEREWSDLPRFTSAAARGIANNSTPGSPGTPTGPSVAYPYYYSDTYTKAQDINEVKAAFADLTFHPLKGLDIFAGGRVSREDLDFNYLRQGYSNLAVQFGTNFDPTTFAPTVGPTPGVNFAGSHNETDWAARGGASYQLERHVSVYGSFSRGYVGAGVDLGNGSPGTAANPQLAVLKPSTTKSYEIGLKSELFDRRVRLNIALFKADTKNVQVSALVPGTNINLVQNAGDIKAKGVEVNAEAKITPDFDIVAAFAYNHANFANLTQGCYPGQAVADGCITDPVKGTKSQNVTGKPALNAPRVKFNITPTYTFRMPNMPFDAYLRADFQYQTKTWYQLDHDPYATQGAYGILNLSVGFPLHSGAFELRAFANNVTNKFYCTNMVNGPTGRQVCQSTTLGAERRFGMSGKVNF